MNEPEPPKLSPSLKMLINSSLFKHLSDEKQSEILIGTIKSHNGYAEMTMDYPESLKR